MNDPLLLGPREFIAGANGRLYTVKCLVTGVDPLGPVASLKPEPPGYSGLAVLFFLALAYAWGIYTQHLLHYLP